METKTLNQMKGSEIHRIVAAVFEVIEKAQFEPKVDATLQSTGKPEDGLPERWRILFQKKSTTIDELNMIRKELGDEFTINLSVEKGELKITIEASSNDFIALLQKKAVHAPSLFNGQDVDVK